jgi:hypothetical protein
MKWKEMRYLCKKKNDIMRNNRFLFCFMLCAILFGGFLPVWAGCFPPSKDFISSDDENIVYMGRISKRVPMQCVSLIRELAFLLVLKVPPCRC